MEFNTTPRPAAFMPTTALANHAASHALLYMAWLTGAGLLAACNSGTSGGPSATSSASPTPAATQVTVVLSSDANDRFTDFGAVIQGITLTNRSGRSVTLLSQSLGTEFVHLNGLVEPMITGALPQDTYTAATVTVGGAQFSCVTLDADGGVQVSTFAYGYVEAPFVTVSLPTPISIAGDSMGLTLGMQIQLSATLSNCSGGASYAITPAFTLGSFDIAHAPPGSAGSTVLSLEGEVAAVGEPAGSVTVQRPAYMSQAATTIKVSTDAGTALQGIDAPGSLAVGMFVNLDGAIQADGSVHATRIAVADPLAVDVRRGTILSVFEEAIPIVAIKPISGQGKDGLVDVESYDFSSTTFHVSTQLSNIEHLPFAANFSADTMVPGQNVYLSSPAFVTCCGKQYYAPATTITLIPQTIDGLILGSAVSGDFTVYTVQLSNDDPFASLAVQPGQATVLTTPTEVQVYVDGSTHMLNSDPVAIGNTLRFYGLVLNDQGVLRMDCAQINDGVSLD